MTPEGLATWITEGVHPEGYAAIATDYLLNHTKADILIPGVEETDTLLTAALDPVWIGQSSVEDALNGSGTVEQINGILQETKANLAGG
jgi:multiple sugar transport system substrate-binding protein